MFPEQNADAGVSAECGKQTRKTETEVGNSGNRKTKEHTLYGKRIPRVVQKTKVLCEQGLKTKTSRQAGAREQNGCEGSTPDRTDERHESHSGRNEVVRSAPGREDRKWICRGRSPIRRGYAAVKTAQKQRKGSDDNAL